MYFEEEYIEIVKDKLMSFLSRHQGMFTSKEEMLKQFNNQEDLSVTAKTFKKWIDSCGFVVTECIVVTPPKPPEKNQSVQPPTHPDDDEIFFDNES